MAASARTRGAGRRHRVVVYEDATAKARGVGDRPRSRADLVDSPPRVTEVDYPDLVAYSPDGGLRAEARFTIDRTDFGIRPGGVLGWALSNDLEIRIRGRARECQTGSPGMVGE